MQKPGSYVLNNQKRTYRTIGNKMTCLKIFTIMIDTTELDTEPKPNIPARN